jgi:endonuclease/exonuclease/phosphatase family metal-dependent hydrolase
VRFGGRGREDQIGQVIRAAGPDVVILQEATHPAAFARIQASSGMSAGQSRAGFSLAFLSRRPPGHVEWHRPRRSRHAFLELDFDELGLRLFGVHLSAVHAAWTEWRRLRELRALLASIERHQKGAHVITGDFNTLAPGATLDVGRLPPRLRPFVWLSGGRVRWRTVHTILDAGYADAYRVQHPDLPGVTFPTWSPQLRLDYAFLPETLATSVRQCDVVTTDEARSASDHFPLFIEIDTVPMPPAAIPLPSDRA